MIQVCIDAQGLMKITHMVNLQHIMDQDSYLGPAAYSESQASIAGAHCSLGQTSLLVIYAPVGVIQSKFSASARVCVWPLCDQSSWVQVDLSRTGIISFMMVAEDVHADDGGD